MLIVKVSETDKLDKALKQFKRKVNNTKLVQELRGRQEFVKPSVRARRQKIKAVYAQKMRDLED